jgi:hypothetical protein
MGKTHDMASHNTRGQSHNRIGHPAGNGALDMPAEPNVIGKPVEVTTSMTQKMLSATTGSLMTSLLGMSRVLSFSLLRDTLEHPLTFSLSNTSRCRPRAPAGPTKSVSVSLHPPALLHPAPTRSRRQRLLPRCLLGAELLAVLRCRAQSLHSCIAARHVRSL